MPDAHLAVVSDKSTGRLHGALYRNRPTPSGCDRYMLSVTTTEGYLSVREAGEAINAAFPDLEPVDVSGVDAGDFPVGGFGFPRGVVVTRMKPRRERDSMEGAPDVDVRRGGMPTGIAVTLAQFERMVALGHLEHESGSGSDPELHFVYDHYVLTKLGREVHSARAAA